MAETRTLGELAEASGIPARTIRFYIARGLLRGPVKSGRGASYTDEHLARLEKIRRLQSKGKTLMEIGYALHGGGVNAVGEPSTWRHYPVQEDVSVWIRTDSSPWRLKQINAALQEFAARVSVQKDDEERKNQS